MANWFTTDEIAFIKGLNTKTLKNYIKTMTKWRRSWGLLNKNLVFSKAYAELNQRKVQNDLEKTGVK